MSHVFVMPSPKYPLKPLLEHRERNVDERTAELGDAIRAREEAERARDDARRAQEEAEARAARVKAEEAERLLRGELRAVDLARGEAWEYAARAEIHQLERSADVLDGKATEAQADEASARAHLAETMADRDVVRKDEARFEDRVKKRALAAEEEAAEEAFRGGKKKP